MPKGKQATKNEYAKQRKRLKQAIRRAEKQGYIFSEDILPKKPKRITKASVRRLAKITPELIRQKGKFLIEETGEIIPVKGNKAVIKQEITRKKQERTHAEPQYLPSFSANVIQRFKSYILGFPPAIYEMLLPLINALIHDIGEDGVATALENMPQQFHEYLHRHTYDSGTAISEFATSLIEYIPDVTIQYKKDLMDKFEYNELGYDVEDEKT
jgi:hypothetical protein